MTDDVAETELDDRDVRALTESMTVLPDGGDVFTVIGENGNGEHRVDARGGRCTCPDHQYRGVKCKHQRRVAYATGARPIPTWVDTDAVDPLLGEHVDGQPVTAADAGQGQAVATDGGEELPEHLTRMSTIDGDDVFHCRTCGAESRTADGVEHHPECPVAGGDGDR